LSFGKGKKMDDIKNHAKPEPKKKLPVRIDPADSARAMAALPDQLKLKEPVPADGEGIVFGNFFYMLTMPAGALMLASGFLPGLLFMVPGAAFGMATGTTRESAKTKLRDHFKNVRHDLKAAYTKAAQNAYRQNKHKMLVLADQALSEKNLLDVQTLSYLAVLNEAELKSASDRLAITVLQARKMLAYSRCADRRADGTSPAEPPLSFASLDLNADNLKHRYILRKQLEQADQKIVEDDIPDVVLPDISFVDQLEEKAQQKVKTGWTSYCGRALAAPLYIYSDIKNISRAMGKVKLPDQIPEVKVPPLCPVDDFAAALATYEEQSGKLDLPALRGWPQAARRLTR